MIVKSVGEAWEEANRIFPTDYMKDDMASKNAGYDVYWSTASGVSAWISDLGDRLEVNLGNGESVNIWIEEEEPKKSVCTHVTHWNSDDWCHDDRATTQEVLQEMAKSIRENCKATGVHRNGSTSVCTTYENANLGLKYWIHDDLGRVSEIIEGREIKC